MQGKGASCLSAGRRAGGSGTYYLKGQVTVPLRELVDSMACSNRPSLRRRGSVGSPEVMAFE